MFQNRGKEKKMQIQTLDGIDIYVLPDNAKCAASDGCVSPEKLDECPMGCKICFPDGCTNYFEPWEGEEHG